MKVDRSHPVLYTLIILSPLFSQHLPQPPTYSHFYTQPLQKSIKSQHHPSPPQLKTTKRGLVRHYPGCNLQKSHPQIPNSSPTSRSRRRSENPRTLGPISRTRRGRWTEAETPLTSSSSAAAARTATSASSATACRRCPAMEGTLDPLLFLFEE